MRVVAGLMLFTADLAEVRRFYGERLGARIEDGDGGFVAHLWGIELVIEGGARPRRLGRRWMEESGVMISLKTDDFDRFVEQIEKGGIALLGGVTQSAEGDRYAGFRDPDGNLFELSELTPVSSLPR